MQAQILSLLLLFPLFTFAQPLDSLAVTHRVDSLIQASRDFTDQGAFEKAMELNEAAEQFVLETLGKESAAYASVSYNYGRVFHRSGNFEESEKWYLQSKAIRENVLGREHPDYATSLHNLGALYSGMGNYEKAETLYQEALVIQEKVLGREHPERASTLRSLGNMMVQMGNFEKSERFLLEAKGILGKSLGKDHPQYRICLASLGNLYIEMTEYEKAVPLILESRAITEKVHGKMHLEYGSYSGLLGEAYRRMGNYEQAERLFLEVLSVIEGTVGSAHHRYASALISLALLNADIGNYGKAESLYKESMAIVEKVFGKASPDYSIILTNLALLYWSMGKPDKGVPLQLESMAIDESLIGKDHPYYCGDLVNLGLMQADMGQYEQAESTFLQAKDIFESEIKNTEHLFYMNCLNNLASLYVRMGRCEEAHPLFLKCRAIQEEALGREHPYYVGNLNNLAVVNWCTGQYERSKSLFEEAANKERMRLAHASCFLSEKELSDYTRTYLLSQNRNLSFSGVFPEFSGIGYDDILFYKGFLLSTARQVNHLAQTGSVNSESYDRLRSCRRRLAQEYARPVANRQNVPELEEEAIRLEKELVHTVAGFGAAIRQVGWKEVQGKLKPGEAAVEFVHFQLYSPAGPADSILYAALVLRPGDELPHFLPLFEERVLREATGQLEGNRRAYLAQLYTRGFEKKRPSNLQGLYELIWEPLDSLLAGVKTVYYSPSGLLHRISQEAIPIDSTMRLADKYQLRLLNSTRSLVFADEAASLKNDALLFGGIEYDKPSAELPLDSTIDDQSGLTFIDITRGLRGGSWKFLPGTKEETQAIAGLLASKEFGFSLKQGRAATEEAFKKIGQESPSPRILHIATHGFFFPDPIDTLQQDILGVREPVFKLSDDPMIRSGLILAGANRAWQGHELAEGEEDGILTAYEISQMNLRNTELVVLSACETGLGDIEGNEGVYGLQRAFKIAGAKYLIMSLWQVPDLETQEFMATFYQEWLGGKTIHQAFRDTQQRMRELNEGPYYWAAFVLIE